LGNALRRAPVDPIVKAARSPLSYEGFKPLVAIVTPPVYRGPLRRRLGGCVPRGHESE